MTSGAAATPSQPDLNMVKTRQQQIWSMGDYQEIGVRIIVPSELLVDAVGVRSNQRVLDVASGTGNAALAAARRFSDVVSTDYVPELLDRGRIRAEAEGLHVTFEVADAESLPYPDNSFDAVLSVFGAMFAPNQERVASELLRVCRPGGKIGMANWTPDGLIGRQFQTVARHVPPPPGVKPPLLWGTEPRLQELFGAGARDLKIHHRHVTFSYPTPEFHVDFFRSNFGPYMTAFAALDEIGQASLTSDLIATINDFNESDDGTVLARGAYLEVVVFKA